MTNKDILFLIVCSLTLFVGFVNVLLAMRLRAARDIIFEKETELCLLAGRELARQEGESS